MEPKNLFDQSLFNTTPQTGMELQNIVNYRKNPLFTIVMEFQVQTLHINLSLN